MKKLGVADSMFQQDEAPAHASQKWMVEYMKFWPKDFWLPQSPNLNPLDYSIWRHIESKTCKVGRRNVGDLRPLSTSSGGS